MPAQANELFEGNPLLGKTVVITYESGAPGVSFEIDFFSASHKTSTGKGLAAGYVETNEYEMVVVAPNVYMVSWMGNDGHVVTAVWNLDTMKAYGTYSSPKPERVQMIGVINEIRS